MTAVRRPEPPPFRDLGCRKREEPEQPEPDAPETPAGRVTTPIGVKCPIDGTEVSQTTWEEVTPAGVEHHHPEPICEQGHTARDAFDWYTAGLLGLWLAEVMVSLVAIGRTWWIEMAVSLAWWAYYGHGPGEAIKRALDQRVEPSPTKPGSIRP